VSKVQEAHNLSPAQAHVLFQQNSEHSLDQLIPPRSQHPFTLGIVYCTFRAIMQSINENDPPRAGLQGARQWEAGERESIGGTRAMLGAAPHDYGGAGLGCGGIAGSLGGGVGPAFGAAPGMPAAYAPRAYSPARSPPSPSFAMRESAAGSAPSGLNVPTSLTSPPPPKGEATEGGPAALDGKDFFRAARLRLSCVHRASLQPRIVAPSCSHLPPL
jgi:hypothetical protein